MVRKLVKSLLSLSIMSPAAALALGLGDVHLHSALNERLKAEIELLSVDKGEADSINVALASAESFAKVGVERPGYLMYLQFEVVTKRGGGYAINVTSKEPIQEPFLDFLVEVDWRSGRVMREYTLLLDPPVSSRTTTGMISAPTTTIAPAVTPAVTPATSSTVTAAREAEGEEMMPPPAVVPGSLAAPAQAVALSRSAAEPMSSGEARAASTSSIVYGPVKANDTLWAIAKKLRPGSDVTVQQMMVALQKANPYAFFDNNINRLKRGYVLRLDDPSMITAMSKAEAVREVARQTNQWNDYRQAAAAKAKARPAAASAEMAAPAGAATKAEPKLTLVAPEGKGTEAKAPGGTAEGKSAEELNQELMLAMENATAQRKENEDLQKRVTGLEEQLQSMEQLISLKDADLAALQKQLREQGKALPTPAPGAAAKPETPEEKPGLVVKPEDAMKAEAPVSGAVPPAEVVKPEEASKPAEVAKPAAAKPAQQKPKPPRKPVAPPPPPEPTLIDMVMDNMMFIIGGLAVLVVGVLLLVFMRRRRAGGFQESILSGGTSSMMKAQAGESAGETSFLSDLAISGMGPGQIQTEEGEVDPLTEADVFMAYGRTQQAEEVLKKALEKSPERPELNAKLLEVYYSAKDKEQFAALAATAAAVLQTNGEVWGKVLAMGYELAPENELFASAAGAELPKVEPMAKHEAAAEDVLDIGIDLDELTADMEGEATESSGLDLDLGLDFSDLEEAGPMEAAHEEIAEVVAEPAPAETEAVAEPEEESTFEFDLDLGGAEEAVAAEEPEFDLGDFNLEASSEEAPAAEEMVLDFDLGELATSEEGGEAAAMELGGDEELDLGAALGEAAAAEEMESLGDLGDFGDLGDLDDLGDLGDLGDLDEEVGLGDADEIATKLDLAQAYIEMGDGEGARSMLEEVVAAGSDEQKEQAQALLGKL